MGWSRQDVIARAAKEIRAGEYVNLGIGMPTMIAGHITEAMNVSLQSENGMLGMGPHPRPDQVDPDLINAGKQTITELAKSSYFSSSQSFGMIRGGHIDQCFLGAMEVTHHGDLANWMIPGKMVKGMGGAMDLISGVKRVVVLMDHCAKTGAPKILEKLSLPCTGLACVDEVITDLGVFRIERGVGMTLIEIATGASLDEIAAKTSAPYEVAL